MARVLICHAWAVAREGMRTQLEGAEGIEHVTTTASGMSAVIAAMSGEVDVVVTGTDLEGLGEADLVERLRREPAAAGVRVVMLLTTDEPAAVSAAVRLEPDGLILQECSSEELRFTVRAVARGRVVLGTTVAGCLMDWFRTTSHGTVRPLTSARSGRPEAPGEQAPTALTAREAEVLEHVAEGHTTDEIAADLFISTTTVRSHLFRLRSKIGVRDRAGLVNFAFRSGMVRVA